MKDYIVISSAAQNEKSLTSCAKNFPPIKLQDSSKWDISRRSVSSVWCWFFTSSLTFVKAANCSGLSIWVWSVSLGLLNCSNSVVIGITENKLDNTVYDSEVTVDGYNIFGNDTTETVEG